jgi:hypothetical protein
MALISSSENLFFNLPLRVQAEIDDAFDNEACYSGERSTTHQLANIAGGGFLPDETGTAGSSMPEPGKQGFIPTHIKLSFIPAALQKLNLSSDDDEILSVFRNAASGWSTTQSDRVPTQATEEASVSRADWRSVCAVLLEGQVEAESAEETNDPMDVSQDREESASDDDYSEEGEDEDGDDLYNPDGDISPHKKTRRNPIMSTNSDDESQELTSQQLKSVKEAFALFFPSIEEQELGNQKIMLKDIQRIAKLLGEKVKAEEVCSCHSNPPAALLILY